MCNCRINFIKKCFSELLLLNKDTSINKSRHEVHTVSCFFTSTKTLGLVHVRVVVIARQLIRFLYTMGTSHMHTHILFVVAC